MKKTITFLLLFLSLQISAQCWQSISAGYIHSLAVKDDGTLWAWGSNGDGRLGDNTTISKIVPTQIGTANNWSKVCASFSASYAIKTDGTLWSWGWNGNGELGLGTSTSTFLVPTQVGTDTNWQSISSKDYFCIALKSNGTLWAWGRNDYGQLGANAGVYQFSPMQVGTDTNWQSISAGYGHSLAIKSNGTLWAWGENANGKLGLGTSNTVYLVPTQVGTATNWLKVDGGFNHTLGIKTDGTLWAWGSNANGQFGKATPTASTVPTQVGTDTTWQDVSASQYFSYAIKTNKTLWSAGRNEEGQLGNGTSSTTNVFVFTQVGSFSDSEKIATGYYHVLNTNQDGFIRVTGRNSSGQLGDGTTTQKTSLTNISCYTSVLSTDDFAINLLKVYPNPVNDILNFSFDKEIKAISIYNLLGQEVITKSVNKNETSIDVTGLSAGTYLVKITSDNEVKTMKVVKN